jgi:hypothetical protein
MDCKDTAARLQELLDGALPLEEEIVVRGHLKGCSSCGRVFRQLSVVGRAVAALPLYSPSPALRAAVLASLAGQRRLAAGLAWVSAPALALVSCGLAISGWLLGRALSIERILAGWRLVCEPGRAAALLKLDLARSMLYAWRLCGSVASWLPSPGPGPASAFPLQLAAALLLAGAILAFTVRGAARPAPSSHWRSL